MPSSIPALAERIRAARRVTAMTGAGVSAASGVPTFRGADGLWKRFRPEELATPAAFLRDPVLVWEWYDWRRSAIARCAPNAAHDVLARWTRRPGFTLITQNVDGLHERAGATDAIRVHGSIWELSCTGGCGKPAWEDHRAPLNELPPRCPACGGLARPAVVWFGEGIDPAVWDRCQAAVSCDLFLSIGTSSVVYPAAGLVQAARTRGAYTVEINPEATEASESVDLALSLRAEDALPLLDAALQDLEPRTLNPEP